MRSEFETKFNAALRNSRPSSKNLSVFALDIEHYLEQTGLFSGIRLKKTGEPERALFVTCQISDSSIAPGLVTEKLAQLWKEAPLGYGGEYDAYEFQHNAEQLQMRFVTVADR